MSRRSASNILIVVMLFLASFQVHAQDLSEVKSQLIAMFSGLDTTRIATHRLWDRAVNLVNGEDYNGSALTDSNYVDLPRLYDMIFSINSASLRNDTIPAARAIQRIQESSTASNAVIGVLFKPYNYIVADALQDNLITYNNQVVSDRFINGVWQNPYGEAVLVGHAIGNNGTVCQEVSYTLQSVDSLVTPQFDSIMFDAGDGNGYCNVSIGTPISVSYTSDGYKETKLKLVKGGITYLSHSIVNVFSPSQSNQIVVPPSYYCFEDFSVSIGRITYYARVTYRSTASFDKPLIVAEGFDPWVLKQLSNDGPPIHDYSGFTDIEGINKVIFSDYDVFYIDWKDCGADISVNARLLEKVINWVNDNKTSGISNVVLGQSMGGLIARYCLCSMENRNILHDTALFISHDAPHLGVNVSPGIQYFYWDLFKTQDYMRKVIKAFGKEEVFEAFLSLGSYTSVRQMLMIYLNAYGVFDNSVYNSFQSTLDNMGFPHGDPGHFIDNVAIVNGGKAHNGATSYYTAGDTLFHLILHSTSSSSLSFLLSFIDNTFSVNGRPLKSNITLSYDVYPFLPSSSVIRSSCLTFTKTFLWRPSEVKRYENQAVAPSIEPFLDDVTSSYYHVDSLNLEPSDSISFLGIYGYEVDYQNKVSFVPTASALCYNGSFNDIFYTNSSTIINSIPFDSFIVNEYGSRHISFGIAGLSDWFTNVRSEVYVPPVIFEGDTLKVKGTTQPFNWSSSNIAVATTVNDSLVHYVSDGLVEFTATYTGIGQAITKTRKAIVGYPSVSLSSRALNSSILVVKASSLNSEKDQFITQAVKQGILRYRWGVKSGTNSSIIWRETMNDTIHVSIPDSLNYVTVFMDWKHGTLYEGDPCEMIVRRPQNFSINLDRIEFNSSQQFMAFIEDPTHAFPSITSYYGFPCIVFSRVSASSAQAITSITINNNTFPLSGRHYVLQNGDTFDVYAFNIIFDPTFQDIVFGLNSNKSGVWFLDIILNDSIGEFQTIRVLCYQKNFH